MSMDDRNIRIQEMFLRGAQLLQAGDSARALSCFESALEKDDTNPVLCLYAGVALHELKKYDQAVLCYEKVLMSTPLAGEVHNNLGNSLMALGRFSEAVESFSRAVELLPASPIPLAARATSLQALGKILEAESDCRGALALDSDFAAAHWNLALNLLLQGQYAEGWREYEWRWKKPDFTSPCRHADVPLWDGSPLCGRTLLLHTEQGFGDAIQFARYVQIVAGSGDDVMIECHPELVQLLQSIAGVRSVVPFGAPLRRFDIQAPLLSLPHILGTTLHNIPSDCPYLFASPAHAKKWTVLFDKYHAILKVGLVWAGKSYPDPLRSCRLTEFVPLAAVSGVAYFSLQLGTGAEQLATLPSGLPVVDMTAEISDFADTAAMIMQLDMVVTIDTAVAHLAGALGRPVWILLPFAPDWRWLLERSDSPWYPTMRIFRQNQPGDWNEVMARVYAELVEYAG